MKHGICTVAIAPIRSEASDTSEMVSQLLFGEVFEVMEKIPSWIQIKTHYDNYTGWISDKQFEGLFADLYDEITSSKCLRSAELLGKITYNGSSIKIPMGSYLPLLNKGIIKVGFKEYEYNGRLNQNCEIAEIANQFLNAPYLWGGKTLMGIDCSGFTQIVFGTCDKSLPRDAYQQAEIGETIDFIEQAQEGDLAFFDNDEGKIIHVGIILKDQKIIHSSGKVRIDKIDHEGIFNDEKKVYSHRLRIIKRA